MSKKSFKAEYQLGQEHIRIGVEVFVWEENGTWFAMAPALDMTGYGKTEVEAGKSFEVMMDEFIAYTHRKKTIFTVLEGLGWTTNRKKKRVAAPSMDDIIKENDDVKEMMGKPGLRMWNKEVQLAL